MFKNPDPPGSKEKEVREVPKPFFHFFQGLSFDFLNKWADHLWSEHINAKFTSIQKSLFVSILDGHGKHSEKLFLHPPTNGIKVGPGGREGSLCTTLLWHGVANCGRAPA